MSENGLHRIPVMKSALEQIQETHVPAQVWHQRFNINGTLISSTTTDGPCVICNPTITDAQHCPDCTNDGSEGGHEDTWCEGVAPSYTRTLWPCPTRKLADEGLTDRMARTNQGENNE